MYSKIIGTGSYLPEQVVTNKDLEQRMDTSDAWITERTGIKQRHIAAAGETSASMAVIAAQRALQLANKSIDDIDLIIVGTCTPERVFPSVACLVQNALGATKDAMAFDLTAACAGFVYGVSIADQYIKNNTFKTALVIGSESLSRVIDWEDRSTCILFGDGAGAVILEQSEQPGILASVTHAQGRYNELLYLPNDLCAPHLKTNTPFVKMRGNEVFKFAVKALGDLVIETLELAKLDQQQIDWLVPHQANYRIIKATAKKLNLPMDKVILTVAQHANTSSASIPLALDSAWRKGTIKPGETVLMEGIGGGFAWGSILAVM